MRVSMIVCYCPVSTQRQKNNSQRAEITRWLQGHGANLATVPWFEDKESGKTLDRTGFEKLRKAIFSGEVKTVVV
jgi:DNA invertase Pin-like site-specific DNA recombinase